MKPYEFEQLVCDHYRQKGYRVQTTSASNDYGIDVFAEKKGEKIAVQVKMYGGSTRKVNRQTMMELYGAAAYFDCTKAVLATDGEVLTDAKEVAHKLGIDILFKFNCLFSSRSGFFRTSRFFERRDSNFPLLVFAKIGYSARKKRKQITGEITRITDSAPVIRGWSIVP